MSVRDRGWLSLGRSLRGFVRDRALRKKRATPGVGARCEIVQILVDSRILADSSGAFQFSKHCCRDSPFSIHTDLRVIVGRTWAVIFLAQCHP